MSFPNRPDTADFWLLAEVVQDFDSAADDGTPIDRLIAPIVDMDSLVYMAQQRALRAQMADNPLIAQSKLPLEVKLAGLWMEGFAAGAQFQKRKGRK